jgi:hypothetical protein
MQFFQVLSGCYSGVNLYGITLQVLSAIVLMPFIVLASIFGFIPEFGFFVLYFRFFQLGLYLFGIWYLYRLTALLTNRWLGLAAALLCLPMQVSLQSIMMLKTDLWVMSFSVAAMFHLIRFTGLASRSQADKVENPSIKDKNSNSDIILAGINSGLALSSKIFGIFIIIPAVFALFVTAVKQEKAGHSYLFKTSFKFFSAMFLAFVFTQLQYVVQPLTTMEMYGFYSDRYMCIPKWGSTVGHLFMSKISNFMSVQFVGPLLPVLFTLTLFLLLFYLIRRLNMTKKIELEPVWIILSYIMAFLSYYFVLYNDTFNIYGGYRYLISCVVFMIPVVMSGINYLHKSKFKPLANILLFLLLASQILQFLGFGLDWRPRQKLVHWDSFKQWLQTSNESDRQSLKSIYGFRPDDVGNCVTMKENPSLDELKQLVGKFPVSDQLGYQITPFYNIIKGYANIENLPKFRVRDWVKMHARPNSVILVEFYMNLLSEKNLYTPIDDLPVGTKIIRVDYRNMQIKEDEILLYDPDYIFTAHKEITEWIPVKFPCYRVADVIGGAVFILEKTSKLYKKCQPSNLGMKKVITKKMTIRE